MYCKSEQRIVLSLNRKSATGKMLRNIILNQGLNQLSKIPLKVRRAVATCAYQVHKALRVSSYNSEKGW